jgi:hypothetical protein
MMPINKNSDRRVADSINGAGGSYPLNPRNELCPERPTRGMNLAPEIFRTRAAPDHVARLRVGDGEGPKHFGLSGFNHLGGANQMKRNCHAPDEISPD